MAKFESIYEMPKNQWEASELLVECQSKLRKAEHIINMFLLNPEEVEKEFHIKNMKKFLKAMGEPVLQF